MPLRTENHVAATPTVSSIRSAFGHKFFPPKTHATASTLPSLGKNFDPIHKHGAFKLPLAGACVIPGEATTSPTIVSQTI